MGRNLVHLLVSQNLVQYIKVADKGIPEMSYFHEKYMEAFQSPLVQYEQDDLTKLVYSSLHYIVHRWHLAHTHTHKYSSYTAPICYMLLSILQVTSK